MSKEAPDDPSEWGVEEVCAWASGLHLESASAQSVSEALARNDVDGAVLVALDNATLRDDIGVSSFGLRRKVRSLLHLARVAVCRV
ncbi:hypothetical protein BC830DRAFT_1126570 [Chytriomyces sp. MP71]|nr:hypothetical protein BC830DRAFT_1126570 [Chytriomyces sp. MP71]